jgi:hypothetical protein
MTITHSAAVEPDLAARPGEWAEVAHLHRRGGEVVEELRRVGRVDAHERVRSGVPAPEQRLVGLEQHAACEEVAEVSVVEGVGRLQLHRREVAVAAGGRADAAEPRGEGGVHGGGVVVDVAAEGDAPGLPHGVRARQRRQVTRLEALVAELGHEPGDVRGRLLFAASWLAVRASRRPNGTTQLGPPSCAFRARHPRSRKMSSQYDSICGWGVGEASNT